MKFAPLTHKFFIILVGIFFSPLILSAQGFESWKDLSIYYKKNNFQPENLTEKQLEFLPILESLPEDFKDLQDDKALVFDGYDTLKDTLTMGSELINNLKPIKENMFLHVLHIPPTCPVSSFLHASAIFR